MLHHVTLHWLKLHTPILYRNGNIFENKHGNVSPVVHVSLYVTMVTGRVVKTVSKTVTNPKVVSEYAHIASSYTCKQLILNS